jgi:hypothetical protein
VKTGVQDVALQKKLVDAHLALAGGRNVAGRRRKSERRTEEAVVALYIPGLKQSRITEFN